MLGEGRGTKGTLQGPREDTFLGLWSSTRDGKEGKGREQVWSRFSGTLEPVVEGVEFGSTSGDSRDSWAQGRHQCPGAPEKPSRSLSLIAAGPLLH